MFNMQEPFGQRMGIIVFDDMQVNVSEGMLGVTANFRNMTSFYYSSADVWITVRDSSKNIIARSRVSTLPIGPKQEINFQAIASSPKIIPSKTLYVTLYVSLEDNTFYYTSTHSPSQTPQPPIPGADTGNKTKHNPSTPHYTLFVLAGLIIGILLLIILRRK